MRIALISLLLSSLPSAAAAPNLEARRTSEKVQLDGQLNEPAWQSAPAFDGFVESFPVAGKAGDPKTLVRVLYDDEFIKSCRDRIQLVRERYTWETVLAPLVEFCRNPRPAADRSS